MMDQHKTLTEYNDFHFLVEKMSSSIKLEDENRNGIYRNVTTITSSAVSTGDIITTRIP